MIRSIVKRKFEAELHTQPNKIIKQIMQLNKDNYLNHCVIHLLRNSIYTARKKHFPNLLNYFNNTIYQLKNTKNFIL